MYMGVIVCVSIYSSESVSVLLYCMYIVYLCAMRVVYVCMCMYMCAYMFMLYGTSGCTFFREVLLSCFFGTLPFASFFGSFTLDQ